MQDKKHIVIFSHGFGTKKDDRGLLSGENGIAEALKKNGVETVLFDYNDIDDKKNTITVKPLREQVEILKNIVNKTINENPDATVDIIAHSQGCLVPASLLSDGIRKVVLLTPSLDANNQRMIDLFKDHPDTVIDLENISRLGRKDGTTTLVPSLYWVDIVNAAPILLYNNLSKISEVIIIKAKNDDILGNLNINGISEEIKIINLDGDHSFNGDDRNLLIKTIKEIIL